jgi:hypothetical protein
MEDGESIFLGAILDIGLFYFELELFDGIFWTNWGIENEVAIIQFAQ